MSEDTWTVAEAKAKLSEVLERAQSEQVREFATSALKTDFRALLREVEPTWAARLVNVQSRAVHGARRLPAWKQ